MEARVKSSLECIRRISGVRVLVVGDVMLDTYLDCRALGVADEAPVPLLEVRSQSSALGGAANVARNLARLGAHTALVGLVGGDSQGEVVGKLLRESGWTGCCFGLKDRPSSRPGCCPAITTTFGWTKNSSRL